MTGQRGRIQSRAARKDAPAVKRGRVLVPQLTGQTACRARDTRQPPAEAPPRGTAGDVSAAAGQAGEEAAAVARTVSDWAVGSHLHLASGTGPSYPPLTAEADSGRTRGVDATAASWSCMQARMAAARPESPSQVSFRRPALVAERLRQNARFCIADRRRLTALRVRTTLS
jgi:hypothetical protein